MGCKNGKSAIEAGENTKLNETIKLYDSDTQVFELTTVFANRTPYIYIYTALYYMGINGSTCDGLT